MKHWLFALLIFGGSTCAWAQQDKPDAPVSGAGTKPELPAGPLLATAPRFSEWLVTYSYPPEHKRDPKTPAPPRPAYLDTLPSKVTTTRTNNITHEAITDVQGRTTERWFDGPKQFFTDPRSKGWLQASSAGGITATNSGSDPLPASGFRDLGWVNEENYAGTLPYGNGTCLIFVIGGYHAVDLREVSKKPKLLEAQPRVAYVDVDTRMPVALRESTTTRVYHFNDPPVEMQVLPADLLSAIAKGEADRRRLAQPAARPN